MNNAWISIKSLIDKGFHFKKTYDSTIAINQCIGEINGIASYHFERILEEHLKAYELELDHLRGKIDRAITEEIHSRNKRFTEWINNNNTPGEYEKASPYSLVNTVHYESYLDWPEENEVIEITDPPCAKIRVRAYAVYYDFYLKLIDLHRKYFNVEGIEPELGFIFNGQIKVAFDFLSGKKFIQCKYPQFKAVFVGRATGIEADKIDWIGPASGLKYFIKQIAIVKEVKHADWVTASACFKVNGENKSPSELSGGQRKMGVNTRIIIDKTIKLLKSMSHR